MASEKRCHYEILNISRDSTQEEIRSAYKKLALQRHPDKLIQTGIPPDQATSAFQELVNAYEVLSDPRERAWYDSHRSQILFADTKSSKSSGPVPDLFSYFSNSVFSGFGNSGKGFYKVYSDVFNKIYNQEVMFVRKLGLGEESVRVAPLMGDLKSDYEQVTAFYSYWLGFVSVMDFCWVDEYDVMAGPNRKSRRVMEEENKKVRKKARKEYNETVRGLAEFVKKRDKRVIDMQIKRTLEMEKRKEEEKKRKKEAQRVKLEKARLYEEPEWAKVEESEIVFEEEEEDEKKGDGKELYCVVCSKKFKSDKQWKNHEQSKKHREKVAEYRDTFESEEEEEEEDGEVEELGGYVDDDDTDFGPSAPLDNAMDDLREKFENDIGFQEDKNGYGNPSSDGEGTVVSDTVNGDEATDEELRLKTMASGRKNRKKAVTKRQPEPYLDEIHASTENEEMDLMGNNSRRNARKSRAAKKEGVRKSKEEPMRAEMGRGTEKASPNSNGDDVQSREDSSHAPDSMSEEADLDKRRDPLLDQNQKVTKQRVNKKDTGKGGAHTRAKDSGKEDSSTKAKNTSKGKKQKATLKNNDHSCETCGESFESKNRLHRHLGDTGHASLKSR
ncbi:hypothetical protein IFM89_008161 [Coptis chinensis]|uniref:Uncharacterized protein n=1 Tax=Coptis chinensis TaxID=261450 RepID=A0A835IZ59_9MAGN|nr:hypothetical protein IFM89_008161 [Coptis chinensis]